MALPPLYRCALLALCLPAALPLAAQEAPPENTGTAAEFRALHSPDGVVVWAGGRGGVILRSTDGGRSLKVDTLADARDLFVVGIHGADSLTAHALATHFDGGMARIYRTTDGGRSWQRRYEDGRAGVFMDALACWDVSRCVAFGDPVDGAFVVARTNDGGDTWTRVPAGALPPPLPGEAGFAASGRALVTGPGGVAWFGTGGGPHARVYRTGDYGATWTAHDTPLAGGASAGIFALAFLPDGSAGLAVGGDYQLRSEAHPVLAATSDGGRSWHLVDADVAPAGVRYGATLGSWGGHPAWFATGPAGAGYSMDGITWHVLDAAPYNTVQAVGGKLFLAGPAGAFAVLRPGPPPL